MPRTKKLRTRAAAKKRQRTVARKRATPSTESARPAKRRAKATGKKRPASAARPRGAPARTVPSFPGELPAGATKAAFRRPEHPGGGPPGSGAGPRHADEDAGTEFETTSRDYYEETSDAPLEDEVQDPLEKGPPYAGIAGGAVGGTPAQVRASGGRTRRG